MSKSYGKYKTVGFCTGSNTEYYRYRARHQRRVNNHQIRNVIANNEIEEFDDEFIEYTLPKKDHWEEPTDGSYKVYPDEVKNYHSIRKVKDKNKVKK